MEDTRIAESLSIPELPVARFPGEAWSHRILTGLATALDRTMLRAMERVVDALFAPSPENLPELRASAERLADPALQREPRRFFAFGDDPPVPIDERHRLRRQLDGGAVMARELDVRYRPFGLLGSDAEVEERILLEHWMHDTPRPRGVVLALHGFTMGRPRFDAVALFASQWFRRGLDVALVTLPYHGARTPPAAHFSGEHFAVPHVARLSEAVRQAVWEIRLAAAWLREVREAPVGLLGLSLGGYLAALAAGLWDEFDFVVPMVSPVCIGDLAWRFIARGHRFRKEPPALTRRELRSLYWVHSPLAHPLRVPRERALIVAGRGDRIVPPEHPAALWQHWGEPVIHWFSGSHLAPFGRGRIVDAIDRHLRCFGVL